MTFIDDLTKSITSSVRDSIEEAVKTAITFYLNSAQAMQTVPLASEQPPEAPARTAQRRSAHPNKGRRLSAAHREKISAAQKRRHAKRRRA